MTFEACQAYVHRNMRDVYMFVVGKRELPSGTMLLRVKWHLNDGRLLVADTDTVKIDTQQFKNWRKFKNL